MSQPRGQMVHIPSNTWSETTHPDHPQYDAQASNRGHITTHPNNPQPPKES